MNLMETHFNIQRRLYDYQLALTRTPCEFDEAHQRFLAPYNTPAPPGLLKQRVSSPFPFAARQAQAALLERTPQDSMIVSRPPAVRRPAASPLRAGQLGLFAAPQIA